MSLWYFLILLLSQFQTRFLFFPTPSQLCLHDEKYALLQLKQKHHHVDPYSNYHCLESWNKPNIDCCHWEGITCNGTTGHVVGLELSNSSLRGSIHSNSSLFDLRHLQKLNLSWNQFNYFVPSGFDRLSRIMYLNLSSNSFPGKIPSQISQLKDLVSLDLSMNNFGGEIQSEMSQLSRLVFLDLSSTRTLSFSPEGFSMEWSSSQLEIPNLRAFVQNLSSLTELHLNGVNLSAQKNRDWCHHLSPTLPNLHTLSMINCSLIGPLDSSISSLHFLLELYLDLNQNLSSTVPSSLVNLTSLTILSLSQCGFHGDFPNNVFFHPSLMHIELSESPLLSLQLPEFPQVNNALQYLGGAYTNSQGKLPSSIGNLKVLKELYLVGCNFSSPIPPSLANLTHLTILDLFFNNFNSQIPSIFRGRFCNLDELHLRGNLIEGPIYSYLFYLPSLSLLELSDNKLSEVIIYESIHNVSSFSIPRLIDLSHNYLKQQDLVRLISKIKVTFQSLDLSFNDFGYIVEEDTNLSCGSSSVNCSGTENFVNTQIQRLWMSSCNISKFPDFLRKQKKLFVLDLSSNRIDGAIPKWIWQKNLSSLDLSNNSLTGLELPLPDNHFLNIEFLDLDSNKIQDCLPTVPCSPQTFNQYDSDQFVSPILGNLTSLLSKASFFSISNNNLTGKIPFSICNASNLSFLEMSNNQLSGTIPTCLGSEILEVLHLERNKLTGNIPSSICNANNKDILDLSNNLLSGTITTCLGSSNLGVLNLESKKLHGPIPPTFRSGCSLHTLKLNKNILQGRVPGSLANCKELELLDIGDNQLNDTFPYWLENLFELRVLVMRSNNFSGPIGQISHVHSPFPKLHVFDISSNNFTGNLPLQYILLWKAMMNDEDNSELQYLSFQGSSYYQDTIAIVDKGIYIEMQSIVTTFTTVDLSSNKFNGGIPDSMGDLKSLMLLNLSGNSLMGQIPSSLGNLSKLESLDLSRNNLSGQIPSQLTSLTFISILNLSDNNLIGIIPQGKQFDTFSNTSYEGNTGLCGFPLSRKCGITARALPPILTLQQEEDSTSLLDWRFALAGYCSGLIIGLVIGQQLFWRNNQCVAFCLRIRGSQQRRGLKRKHNIRRK